MKCLYVLLIIFLGLYSCAPEDIIVEVESGNALLWISSSKTGLQIDDTVFLTARFTNVLGEVTTTSDVLWYVSDNDVISVDDNVVTATALGSSFLWGEYQGATSDSIIFNVVADTVSVAQVVIVQSTQNLKSTEAAQFVAEARNVNETVLDGAVVRWTSSNESVAVVDADGVVTAIADGVVQITATSDGVNSNALEVSVVADRQRGGSFVGLAGHRCSGVGRLIIENDSLYLELQEDFSVESGPDLDIYLSNSDVSKEVIREGILIKALSGGEFNGYLNVNVSKVFPNTSIDDYDYIIIHCTQYNIAFGGAELN